MFSVEKMCVESLLVFINDDVERVQEFQNDFKLNFLWFKVEPRSTSNCEATEETGL